MKKILTTILIVFFSFGAISTSVSAAETKISAPSNVKVKSKTDTTVKLSWSKTNNATKYIIYFSEYKTKGYKKYGTTTKTTATVKNLESGSKYYFRIKASAKINGKTVTSNYSKLVTVTTAFDEKTKGSSKIKIISSPGTVKNNDFATLKIKGQPNTIYNCQVRYSSKFSEAEGLGDAKSDRNGYVTWTWKVGTRTKAGDHPIKIRGGGEEITTSFITEK